MVNIIMAIITSIGLIGSIIYFYIIYLSYTSIEKNILSTKTKIYSKISYNAVIIIIFSLVSLFISFEYVITFWNNFKKIIPATILISLFSIGALFCIFLTIKSFNKKPGNITFVYSKNRIIGELLKRQEDNNFSVALTEDKSLIKIVDLVNESYLFEVPKTKAASFYPIKIKNSKLNDNIDNDKISNYFFRFFFSTYSLFFICIVIWMIYKVATTKN
ncbi:hypothetical protein [Companilactobacillus sp. DQM5]|uniref:hypothetical protein n=1 Tax=Companilactobacillus sp. DQM5 TaxID=3463359 RepID=UPI00405938F4